MRENDDHHESSPPSRITTLTTASRRCKDPAPCYRSGCLQFDDEDTMPVLLAGYCGNVEKAKPLKVLVCASAHSNSIKSPSRGSAAVTREQKLTNKTQGCRGLCQCITPYRYIALTFHVIAINDEDLTLRMHVSQ